MSIEFTPKKVKRQILFINLVFFLVLFSLLANFGLANSIHWKLYDTLLRTVNKFRSLPFAVKDIILVTIDNETLKQVKQRWPYPRSDFAKVIENLKKAEARAIGFDFVFIGESIIEEEDKLFKTALSKYGKVVLASTIDETAQIDLKTSSKIGGDTDTGIITKIQDADGIVRRNLTYLVREEDANKGFLSWEMQLLRVAENIKINSLRDDGSRVFFQNDAEKWVVPVDSETKTFLINYRAHTFDFERISFWRVLEDDFDPETVKDKIVLIGFVSSVFQDLHCTPIGWLPGITLNANSFLTLYDRRFLTRIPKLVEIIVMMIGIIGAVCSVLFFKTPKTVLVIAGSLVLFFVLSCFLLTWGYVWNYFLFPAGVIICSIVTKKLCILRQTFKPGPEKS